MNHSRLPPAVLAGIVAMLLALASGCPDALAQGFPGGGGRGGGGRGGSRPSSMQKSNAPTEQAVQDPLASFLATLHVLRMEILIREDQVESWTKMQDALRAYVDLGTEASQQTYDAGIDPLQRMRNLADDARARADAMQKASDSIAGLVSTLDDHQRQIFGTRLADAFAGGTPSTR